VDYAADVCHHDAARARQRRLSGGRRALFVDAPYDSAAEADAAQRAVGAWPPSPPPSPLSPDAYMFGTTPTKNQSLETREAVGVALQPLEVDPDRASRLADLQFAMIRALPHAGGNWHTLLVGVVATRLEVVLTGIRPGATGRLSYAAFDGQPPPEADRVAVRYTRYCEYTAEGCNGACALIDAAGSTALREGTLSLLQASIREACPFDVHIWVPSAEEDATECFGVDYITAANGDAGAFTGQSACSRALAAAPPTGPMEPPSPPTPVSPRTLPSSPPSSPSPPPMLPIPPSTPPSPPQQPPTPRAHAPRTDRSRIVVILLLVAFLGMAMPLRTRRRFTRACVRICWEYPVGLVDPRHRHAQPK